MSAPPAAPAASRANFLDVIIPFPYPDFNIHHTYTPPAGIGGGTA